MRANALLVITAVACTSVEIADSGGAGGGSLVSPPSQGGFANTGGTSVSGGEGAGGSPTPTNPDPTCVPQMGLPAGPPVVLASGLAYPLHLALAADSVFVTEFNENGTTGRLARIPKTGGEVDRVLTGLDRPWHITSSGTEVFWSNSGFYGSVQRYSAVDGSTSVIQDLMHWPFDVALYDGLLYVTDEGGVTALSPQAGGTIASFPTELLPYAIAVDETGAYVSTKDITGRKPSVIMHVDAAGDVTDLYYGNDVYGTDAMVLDGDHLYLATSTGGVWRAAPDAPLVQLATVDDFVADAVVADCFVYFTSHDQGEILRVPLQGGEVQVVATEQYGAYGIAVDGDAIWWVTDSGGTAVRLDK